MIIVPGLFIAGNLAVQGRVILRSCTLAVLIFVSMLMIAGWTHPVITTSPF